MLAFALNIANFNAVKEGGPLMMNVVGNVKQVVMILLSVFMFGNKIKPIGIFGSVVCILGSMWYSFGGSLERGSWIETMKSNKAESAAREEEKAKLLEQKETVYDCLLNMLCVRRMFSSASAYPFATLCAQLQRIRLTTSTNDRLSILQSIVAETSVLGTPSVTDTMELISGDVLSLRI